MDRTIFHIDVNSAFLSWEAVYRLEILGEQVDLREIPSAVAGSMKERSGIILAKSIPAKKYGIKTAETISEAVKKCPGLVIVKPRYGLYEKCSQAFIDLLKEYAPIVEQCSIDEAYADLSGTLGIYGSPVILANTIKDRIRNELGFTVNVGISTNKILAKMASDFKKPDLVHTLYPDEIQKKLWPLPIDEMFFVGRASAPRFHMLGIHTIGELANMDLDILRCQVGEKYAEVLYCFANGIDTGEVKEVAAPNKGYGVSLTIPFDVNSKEVAENILLALSENLGARLRRHQVMTSCLSVEIKDRFFVSKSHQRQLYSPTSTTMELYDMARKLYNELWDQVSYIRQIGIRSTKLTPQGGRQYNLFEEDKYDKYSRLDCAVDKIRQEYGDDSIIRSSFLGSSIYHLSGGISPEKQGTLK